MPVTAVPDGERQPDAARMPAPRGMPVADQGLGNTAYRLDLGGLRLRALGTPGHTDEHLAHLRAAGFAQVTVLAGSPDDWAAAKGQGLETGP
ncbi:MAG TPA: hypothetical protein VFJ94_02335 [Intrasporangium sp.]|uniref:hypothetical protein n=1 Tax=Intrasporangium sp. TaxID=1925024 RepID=UPI002D77C2C9|nr:hypothetical protein [Intrasporangium sp.]HET7397335.1 hypothetical protein [Intrasporangium sp.]